MNNLPLNILTLPFWWYTTGLGLVLKRIKLEYHYGLQSTGLLVFVRHLREPLYGDYTRTGIVMSFFLRLILLAYKLVVFLLRMLLAAIALLLYVILLPALLTMIIFQLMAIK